MKKSMRSRSHRCARYGFFIFGVVLLLAGQADPSVAGSHVGPDVAVGYSDLDLNTIAGATVMLQRIKAAAQRVCAPLYHGTLGSMVKRNQCRNQLIADTVARLNRPAVMAVYESSLKKSRRSTAMPG
jgi:UrcA family protein